MSQISTGPLLTTLSTILSPSLKNTVFQRTSWLIFSMCVPCCLSLRVPITTDCRNGKPRSWPPTLQSSIVFLLRRNRINHFHLTQCMSCNLMDRLTRHHPPRCSLMSKQSLSIIDMSSMVQLTLCHHFQGHSLVLVQALPIRQSCPFHKAPCQFSLNKTT